MYENIVDKKAINVLYQLIYTFVYMNPPGRDKKNTTSVASRSFHFDLHQFMG